MDEERQNRIRARAYALWEASGREPGRDLEHWLRAERELAAGDRSHDSEEDLLSFAGEEDPLVGVDEEPPGTFATDAKR